VVGLSRSYTGKIFLQHCCTSTLNLVQLGHFNLKANNEDRVCNCGLGFSLLLCEELMESELHQLMLERTQTLEAALRKAVDGVATQTDWETICYECGVPKESIFKPDRSEL
jgi:hypothetical protein